MLLIHGLVAQFMRMCLMISNMISIKSVFSALLLSGFMLTGNVVVAQSAPSYCEQLTADQQQEPVSVHCGGAPSATIDAGGDLWVTFVQDKHVYVQRSGDLGESWEVPVQVTPEPEDAEFNGENRPKIIVAEEGGNKQVMLSWTTKTSANFTGEIRFSRSSDGGRHFDEPRTINDDNLMTGHRFDSLYLTDNNTLYLTWIDKRDMEASLGNGQTYPGAAIYYAVSNDLGRSFSTNYRVSHNSCECCRIAMAPHGEGEVAILWRQLFNTEIRDHAIAVLGADGEVSDLQRATYDDWYINACPHHGPTMVGAEEEGNYHMSWFSAGNHHKGIYYASLDLNSGEPAQLLQVDGTPGAGHPYLASHEGTLYLVWKGFDGMNTPLMLKTSEDGGDSWTEAKTLYSTTESSDHPLLVTTADGVYVSWWTQELGYLFQPINAPVKTQ